MTQETLIPVSSIQQYLRTRVAELNYMTKIPGVTKERANKYRAVAGELGNVLGWINRRE